MALFMVHGTAPSRSLCQRIAGHKCAAPLALLCLLGLILLSRSLLLDPAPSPARMVRRRHHPPRSPLAIPSGDRLSDARVSVTASPDWAVHRGHAKAGVQVPSSSPVSLDNMEPDIPEPPAGSQGGQRFAGMEPDDVLHALAQHSEVAFLSIGDWGRNTPEKTLLAGVMANWSEAGNAAFVISTGDSFYTSPTHKMHGISSVDDPYIKECFEDVFHYPSLQRKWFISIGNHDYPPHAPKTNIQAQVEYTRVSKRWYLPATYYTYKIQAKGWSLEIFVLDHYDPREYDSIRTSKPYPIQLPWLDAQLQASTADWKFVLCHRPFYSSGSWHGSYPLWKKAIYPILMKHRVQVYFAGDDHILEALKDSSGLVHIVSGAGSHMHTFGRKDPNSLFKFKEHGFTFHRMNRTHLHTILVDYRGKVLFQFTTAQDEVRPK
eukprot:GGOE01036971.1.p1 GENE.GGOE01036971.1~~GGOE01036971.1.p1  ORF type:complete len:433 (-),score=99.88 GGOE01036971.1:225-1523(-)